ncbi:hypothetical protein Kpho02_62700 [Kitasatospora phosalacinea]|uniref:Uncharacterized protein n=1 Tax=Kitasatospora phosalacinea TaxID=2065 RepID=A0A9W6QBW8_9ACTN|nr:hypothetical protein [Kitasatospora phosalacinea]GLW73972.1 hypothetical protein Kpho02_62700 [Kitasatospora phosalacinea]
MGGQEAPNRLAVSAGPLGEKPVGVTFRAYSTEGTFRAYLLDKGGTVIGTSPGALREGRATITTLCDGTTWQQVLDHQDFEDQVAVVLSNPGQPDLIATGALHVEAY